MGVKKLLEKQDAGFISLHDLLSKMTEAGDGCTLQEAAVALCALLWETDQFKRPSMLNKTNTRGLMLASPGLNSTPMQRLQHIAKTGEFESNEREISDDIPF